MRSVRQLYIIVLAILLASGIAVAQKSRPKSGQPAQKETQPEKIYELAGKPPEADTSKGPKYDVASETKLSGTVDAVKEVPNSCLGDTGVHVMLKTGNGMQEVQIGPVDFLKFMEVTFKQGDAVDVVASKVMVDGKPLYLAREVMLNKNQIVMRDKEGKPAWTWMKKAEPEKSDSGK